MSTTRDVVPIRRGVIDIVNNSGRGTYPICNWEALGAISLSTDELVEMGPSLLSLDGDSVYGRDQAGEFLFSFDHCAEAGKRAFELAYMAIESESLCAPDRT